MRRLSRSDVRSNRKVMMFKVLFTVVAGMAAVALLSGASQPTTDAARLDSLVDRFVKLRRDPSPGVVASAAGRAATFRGLRDELTAIDATRLGAEQRID